MYVVLDVASDVDRGHLPIHLVVIDLPLLGQGHERSLFRDLRAEVVVLSLDELAIGMSG